MLATTLTSKGQATIPAEVREVLHLKPGDKIAFEIADHKAIISKIEPFDSRYYKALSDTLSEWDSPEDDEAYRNL
jgi:AbrB family looped-hinge helix DNA binding protein